MKAEDRIQILKFFLMVFNGVFVIIGLAVFGCGIWILFDKSSFVMTISGGQMELVAGCLFVIGLVVVGVTGLGYVGAAKEVQFLIMLYMGLLIVIFLGQLFVTFILLLQKDQIKQALIDEVDEIILTYGTASANSSAEMWRLLDTVQHYSECCGRFNYTQWDNNVFIQTLLDKESVYPCSCFNSSCPFLSSDASQRFGRGSAVHQQGCEGRISDWLRQNGLTILGMNAGLVLIQVIQFVLSLYLVRSIKKKVKQKRLLSASQEFSATNDGYQHID
ncbi:hypothetical protein AAFF_G00061190 [Aldrovandia affinis]|uniref:Tetraspanin n=1 Tax=Aldrovandia affinis TaxID=143900 RepID=A0AAD7S078_9TELE|nr:hypothetical protein AAFF_G00061190 [Aldrovandia affinis]